MSLVHSYQGKSLICEKTFAFFKKGEKYYCIYDSGNHFYIWCDDRRFGVNEIKLDKAHKENFRISNF